MKLKDFDFRIWDGRKYVNNIKGGVYIHKKDTDVKCLNRNQDCYDYEFQLDDLDNSNLEIELFTGYCDKNGKNIFENDIVKVEDNGNASIFKVGFSNNMGFSASLQTEAILPYQLKILSSKGIEIIGNIHELDVDNIMKMRTY